MNDSSTSFLQKKQKELLENLEQILPHIMRGSLIESYKRCGKASCKCLASKGHGPKYYLSVSGSRRRKSKTLYVPKNYTSSVKKYNDNFKTVQDILKSISQVNRKILKQKKDQQKEELLPT